MAVLARFRKLRRRPSAIISKTPAPAAIRRRLAWRVGDRIVDYDLVIMGRDDFDPDEYPPPLWQVVEHGDMIIVARLPEGIGR